MTAICGGGTSSVQPGISQTLVLSAGGLDLLSLYPALHFLDAIVPLLGILTFELTTLCSTDPPALPTFTTAETEALLTQNFNANYFSGLGKIKDTIANLAWYQYCKCDSGATPSAIVFPTAPANVPTRPPTLTTCYHWDTGWVNTSLFNPNFLDVPIRHASINSQFLFFPATGSIDSLDIQLPVSYFQIVTKHRANGALHFPMAYRFNWAGDTILGTLETFSTSDFVDRTEVIIPPAAALAQTNGILSVQFAGNGGTVGTDQLRFDITAFCNSPNIVGSVGCCSDPLTNTKLDALLSLVTLIQRQHVPFSYVPGTVHPGLSGNGQFSVQGILALSVQLTTVPTQLGLEMGNPNELFDVGWITEGTANGWKPSVRVDHSPTFVPVAPETTLIGYSLHPGVVATISEFSREP